MAPWNSNHRRRSKRSLAHTFVLSPIGCLQGRLASTGPLVIPSVHHPAGSASMGITISQIALTCLTTLSKTRPYSAPGVR